MRYKVFFSLSANDFPTQRLKNIPFLKKLASTRPYNANRETFFFFRIEIVPGPALKVLCGSSCELGTGATANHKEARERGFG